jgi:dihydrolipoamide dehydrogenase
MYDVVVIGGGPGGYAAAIRASQLGGKVALVEAADIGGTCVNHGCIPTKVWQRSAALLHAIRQGEQFGIKAEIARLDLGAVVERKNGVAGDIRMGMEGLLANNGIEVIRGHGLLKSERQIDVEGRLLEARKIILATGSCLAMPDIPGLDEAVLTTDQVLNLAAVPASVLMLGSHPVEVELACTLSIFGCKVYLACPERRILPREDGETSQRIAQALRGLGAEVLPGHTLMSVRRTAAAFEARLSAKQERILEVEKVLVSARRPNTERLGLEQAGVKLREDGSIAVNDRLETTAAGIFAIGDATGGWMLSHAASSMAVTAAENAVGQSRRFPFHLIARGVWSIPEIGAVGLSEEQAEEKGYDVAIGNFPYAINGAAMAVNEMSGNAKIVSESKFGEILGVHIVGAHATELIGEAVLAMQLECTVGELARSIRVHPTFSEAVVDAARDATGWALYLPRR